MAENLMQKEKNGTPKFLHHPRSEKEIKNEINVEDHGKDICTGKYEAGYNKHQNRKDKHESTGVIRWWII